MKTEKEAWLEIAEAFEGPQIRLSTCGLCNAINVLHHFNRISEDTYISMHEKLFQKLNGRHYLWDDEMYLLRKERAQLCREFAEMCEESSRYT